VYSGTVALILSLNFATLRSGQGNDISSEICLLRLTKLDRPMPLLEALKNYSFSGYIGRKNDCWIKRIVSSILVGFWQSPCSMIASLMTLRDVKDLILDLVHNFWLERLLVKSKQRCRRILNTRVLILLSSLAFRQVIHRLDLKESNCE